MRTALLVPLAAVTLTGCGGGTPTGNSTANTTTTTATTETAKTTASGGMPTAASLGLKPGQWQNMVQVLDMDIQGEGMTPAISARMKQAMASRPPETVKSCLTPEDAAKGPAALMAGKMHCNFTKSEIAGGHSSTAMTCDLPTGRLSSTGEGVYTPTSYSVESHGSLTGGKMSMTMHTRTSGEWLGQCDGTEVNAKGKK